MSVLLYILKPSSVFFTSIVVADSGKLAFRKNRKSVLVLKKKMKPFNDYDFRCCCNLYNEQVKWTERGLRALLHNTNSLHSLESIVKRKGPFPENCLTDLSAVSWKLSQLNQTDISFESTLDWLISHSNQNWPNPLNKPLISFRRLKAELQSLRRKGALRPSTDWDNTGPDPDRSCGRCRVELGRVINRGAYCRACRLKVCKSCREYSCRTTDWVCTVCYKHM